MKNAVNACNIFTATQVTAAFPGTTPLVTGNGTPVNSPDGYIYSNCRWDLKGKNLDVHAETYARNQDARDTAVSSLSDDRAQSSGFTFAMEPGLGSEAWYRLNATTGQLNFVKGNAFYSLYLSPTTGMDANAVKAALKKLADQVR